MVNKYNPYPHGNFAPTEDYLEELVLWMSGEKGRSPIPENQGGYEDIVIDETKAKSLTVPAGAISATLTFEVDETSENKSRAVRMKDNGTAPTKDSGQGFGDNDILEIYGVERLNAFQAIGIEVGKSHALRVQYYKTAQILRP